MTGKLRFLTNPHTLARLLAALLIIETALLWGILKMPINFLSTLNVEKYKMLGRLPYDFKLFLAGIIQGSDTIDYARSLKVHASKISETDPANSESDLKQALSIETGMDIEKSTYDNMEIVDSLEQLADIQIQQGRDGDALRNLEEASNRINKQNLYWLQSPMEKYRELLKKLGKSQSAELASAKLMNMQMRWSWEFQKYLQFSKDSMKTIPPGMETGAAVPFLYDYSRQLSHDYASNGVQSEAMNYAKKSVHFDELMPQAAWHKPGDLSNLALMQITNNQYNEAVNALNECILSVNDSKSPDVLILLPQRQLLAYVYSKLANNEEEDDAKKSAEDISAFLAELKSKKGKLSTEHEWTEGDLIQVHSDNVWWSGSVEGRNGDDVKVHFIGFPESQDDVFNKKNIRQHPPYGYSELQEEPPAIVWDLTRR